MKEQIEKQAIEEMRKDVIETHRFFLEDDDYESLDEYIADMLFEKGYRMIVEGEWGYDEGCDCFVCSVCEHSALNNYRGLSTMSNFCPNCGAHMKGGE